MYMIFDNVDAAKDEFSELVEAEGAEVIEACDRCGEFSVSEMYNYGAIICGGSSGYDRICIPCMDHELGKGE